jgi:hypothetical protein
VKQTESSILRAIDSIDQSLFTIELARLEDYGQVILAAIRSVTSRGQPKRENPSVLAGSRF